MLTAGIDIGSRTIKVVVLKAGKIVSCAKKENSFDTVAECRSLLDSISYDTITATGYGRHLFAENFKCDHIISEIKAFAQGAHALFPSSRTILDIGGQDTKAISIDSNGSLLKFEMNDRCAAGTGRFLEIMSMILKTPLAEFSALAEQSVTPQKINNMCTVFAESEVVSMLSRGARREDIAHGILQSIATRSIAQLRRVGVRQDLVFAGGVAHLSKMVTLLSDQLGVAVITAPDPQIIGAVGAALHQG